MLSKAKRTASLILWCFYSKHIHLLLKAFVVYVRPLVGMLLRYGLLTYTIQLISLIENVQRSFTRRRPGLADLSYEERLVNLNIQSLERRRLFSDLTFGYKITHGLTAGITTSSGGATVQASQQKIGIFCFSRPANIYIRFICKQTLNE